MPSAAIDLICQPGSEESCDPACKCNAGYDNKAFLVALELRLGTHAFEEHQVVIDNSNCADKAA